VEKERRAIEEPLHAHWWLIHQEEIKEKIKNHDGGPSWPQAIKGIPSHFMTSFFDSNHRFPQERLSHQHLICTATTTTGEVVVVNGRLKSHDTWHMSSLDIIVSPSFPHRVYQGRQDRTTSFRWHLTSSVVQFLAVLVVFPKQESLD
jgi:hypothetical protein